MTKTVAELRRVDVGSSPTDIPTAMTAGEVLALYAAAYNTAGDYLEIGTLFGGSAAVAAAAMNAARRSGRIVCVDPRAHAEPTASAVASVGGRGEYVVGHSPAALGGLRGRLFGLVFVDGDHTSESVADDFLGVIPLTTPGGLILFHDALNPGVRAGIDRAYFANEFRLTDLGFLASAPHYENGTAWGGVRAFRKG